MKAKDIIKEIDPDYKRCYCCERIIHISKLTNFHSVVDYICIKRIECNKMTMKKDIKEGKAPIFSSVLSNGLLPIYLLHKVKFFFKRRIYEWR